MQLDVNNAFLQGSLTEEVYISQPQGFVDINRPNHVCRLQSSIRPQTGATGMVPGTKTLPYHCRFQKLTGGCLLVHFQTWIPPCLFIGICRRYHCDQQQHRPLATNSSLSCNNIQYQGSRRFTLFSRPWSTMYNDRFVSHSTAVHTWSANSLQHAWRKTYNDSNGCISQAYSALWYVSVRSHWIPHRRRQPLVPGIYSTRHILCSQPVVTIHASTH